MGIFSSAVQYVLIPYLLYTQYFNLSVLYPILFLPPLSPVTTTTLFPLSVSLFLFYSVHLFVLFFSFHI